MMRYCFSRISSVHGTIITHMYKATERLIAEARRRDFLPRSPTLSITVKDSVFLVEGKNSYTSLVINTTENRFNSLLTLSRFSISELNSCCLTCALT